MIERYDTAGIERVPGLAPMMAVLVLVATGVTACDGDGAVIPPEGEQLDVELVASGMTAPVLLRESPDGTGRVFVVDQAGLIRIIDASGTLRSDPFLDLRSSMVPLQTTFDERGLLGLAFHPSYAQNGRFYVYYSAPLRSGAPAGFNHTSRIAEFRVSATDPDRADPASERILLHVDQPQFNHNGGTVAFGPDGFLYISLGDGGGANDVGPGHVEDWYEANEGGNAQNVEANLLGKLLRIDVDGGDPYGIPADNPFVGEAGLDEIYAYGLRNPYRFSFDLGGEQVLLVGDAGQNLYEEVNVVTRGGNYGWNVKEGTFCFDTSNPDQPPASCPSTGQFGEPLIDPVIEYTNIGAGGTIGVVVVGGFVYRGETIPELDGLYIFGDWSASFQQPDGTVLVAEPAAAGLWPIDELRFGPARARLGEYVLGFGQDLSGEVYILTSEMTAPTGSTGKVYRLVLR